MTILWGVLLTVWAILVAVPTMYLLCLTLAACVRRPSSPEPLSGAVSVLAIVPAHNEERGLRRTLESLEACSRAAVDVSVAVIADNCLDGTAEVATACGAEVFVRTEPMAKGKGQALNWFLTNHRQRVEAVDYCAVIDADTVVDPQFLVEAIKRMLADGGLVVQGFYGVSNATAAWRTRLMAAALAVFHHLRPLGRCAVGGTAGLKGNGMVFHRSVLLQYGWPAFSNVEDVEFTIHLALDGVRVVYAPSAQVLGEMPTRRTQATTQRNRWEGGRFGLLKQYAPVLLRAFRRCPSRLTADVLLDLVTPPLAMLIMMQAVLIGGGAWAGFSGLAGVGAAGFLIVLFYVGGGLALRREPVAVWLALLTAPVYVAWKCAVYARLMVFGGGSAWHRTPREGEM